MLQIICDRCGKNCDRNAYVLTVEVIHNPVPVNTLDKGNIKITDTPAQIKMCLCQDCCREMGLPNVYEVVTTGKLEFRG